MFRRTFLSSALANFVLSPLVGCAGERHAPAATPTATALVHLSHLEPHNARLGVAILDTQTGELFGQRLDERFTMCSTFKLPLAAMVLHAVDRGQFELGDAVSYTKADLVPHAPVTEKHLDQGFMTVGELARAGQVTSDNVAANLLLRKLGGPERFTRFCRELGDTVTRLDHYEPELNTLPVGDPRNTTTPRAMAGLLAKCTGRDVLSHQSANTLREWMLETQTGSKRLRAGFPKTWTAGDKTGTSLGKGQLSRYNDLACVWFEDRAPLIVTSFLESREETENMRDGDQAVLARVGLVAGHWAEMAFSPAPAKRVTP